MAFNRIGNSVVRRQQDIEVMRRKVKGVADIVRSFLAEAYGSAIAERCAVRYAESMVTVRTPTKRLASDLLLRSGELSAVIRAARHPLKRIVVS